MPGDHSVLSSSQLSALCSPTSPGSPISAPPALASPSTPAPAKAIPIPGVAKPVVPRMRNSIEGLNQEIERLVLKGTGAMDKDPDHDKVQCYSRQCCLVLPGRTVFYIDRPTKIVKGDGEELTIM